MHLRTTCCIIALIVPWISIHAQPWSFTPLPRHTVVQVPGDLVAGTSAGFLSMPPVVWNGTAYVNAQPPAYDGIVASSIDSNETMTAVLSTGSLIRVTKDGVLSEKKDVLSSARAVSLVCYDIDRTLIVCRKLLSDYVLVYDLDNVTTTAIDTIKVDSVATTTLYHNRVTGSVSLTIVHTVDKKTDTTSFDWNRSSRLWSERDDVHSGTMIVFPDGEVKWYSVTKTQPFNHAVLVDDRVILAMYYRPYVQVASIQRSDDRGLTYTPVPELDTLIMEALDVEAWPDGSVMFSTRSHGLVQWYPDGRVLRPVAPRVGELFRFPGLIAHSAGSERLLGTGWPSPPDPVWSFAESKWESLPDSVNAETAYVVDDHVFVQSQQQSMSIWNPQTMTSIPILFEGLHVYMNKPVAAVRLDHASVLIVANSAQWFLVNSDGTAQLIMVELPSRNINQSATGPVILAGGAVRAQNGDILVGSRSGYYYDSNGVLTPQAQVMGVLRTSDLGKSWTSSSEGLGSDTYIWQLQRGGDGVLYCLAGSEVGGASRGELYVSRDEGVSWTRVPASLPASIERDVRLFVSKYGHITVSGKGLVRSTNGGATWAEVVGTWPTSARVTYALELPWDNRLAVATTQGIYISDVAVSVNEEPYRSSVPCRDVKVPAQLIISDLRGRVVHAASSLTDPAMEVPATLPNGVYLMSINGCASTIVVTR